MSNPIVILAERDPSFSTSLTRAIGARGIDCVVRSLDAALDGRPVTVGDGGVTWEGVSLQEAGVVLLERPLFSWPQPSRLDDLSSDPQLCARQVTRQREARALALSAVLEAAASRPVVNRTGAGSLCASRAVALTQLEAAGLPVHSWSVVAAGAMSAHESVQRGAPIIMDLIGAERWHTPSRPPEGDHGLALEPLSGEVLGILLVGGVAAGALRYASAEAWAVARGGEYAPAELVPQAAVELGRSAAACLDLEVAEVWIGGGPRSPSVLLVEAGPCLRAWDAALKGHVSARICDRLVEIAGAVGGES